MSAPAAVAAILDRIASLAQQPAAARELDTRFGALLAEAAPAPEATSASSGIARTNLFGVGALAGTTYGVTGTASGVWVDRIPNERGKALAPAIQAAAERHGLDPAFLAAVFWTESSYTPNAVSKTGAIGLGQLMPETADWLGVDPWDPMQNMEGSAKLYRFLLDRNHGDLRLAIASYAAGPAAVQRAGGVPDEFTARYIDKLLARTDYLAGRRSTAP